MVSQVIRNLLPEVKAFLATQPMIKKAWIFGSCAVGEENSDSDVDFLVNYDRSYHISMFTLGGIINNLEKIFQRKIDLVEDGYLIPEAQINADKQKILIYERKNP